MIIYKNLEEILNIVADSQNLIFDDELAMLIEEYADSELSEESLMLVSAASKSSYSHFLERYNLR
jgi:hypothetical protein